MKKRITFQFNDSQCEVCGEKISKTQTVNEVKCCSDCVKLIRKEVYNNERINQRIN